MLLEFSVGNFKSIKDVETLSMHSSNLQAKFPHLEVNNIFEQENNNLKLLKSKAIYGANASGKSNIYKALFSFKKIIKYNVGNENTLSKNIIPFKLCDSNKKEPTFFQIQFVLANVVYRYGFLADKVKIHSEWLFKKVDRETPLFTREYDSFDYNKSQFSEGKILDDIFSRSNEKDESENSYLFLTLIHKLLRGKISTLVYEFIAKKIILVSGLDSDLNKKFAEEFIENKKQKDILVNLVKAADMGIDDIDYVVLNEKEKDINTKKFEEEKLIFALKKVYNNDNIEQKRALLTFNDEESKGTQKMFELAPYIINCLNGGGVLFIDEFDSRFHSLLTQKIVELFNSRTNIKGQLIFVTHDTNLLNAKLLRRDQISFASRDKYGASHYYSLAEFKGVRNNSSFENDYINGKYGAIPFLKDFEEYFIKDGKED